MACPPRLSHGINALHGVAYCSSDEVVVSALIPVHGKAHITSSSAVSSSVPARLAHHHSGPSQVISAEEPMSKLDPGFCLCVVRRWRRSTPHGQRTRVGRSFLIVGTGEDLTTSWRVERAHLKVASLSVLVFTRAPEAPKTREFGAPPIHGPCVPIVRWSGSVRDLQKSSGCRGQRSK